MLVLRASRVQGLATIMLVSYKAALSVDMLLQRDTYIDT